MDDYLQENVRRFWRTHIKEHYTYNELGRQLGIDGSVIRKRLTGITPINFAVVTLFVTLTPAPVTEILGLENETEIELPRTLVTYPGYKRAERKVRRLLDDAISDDDWIAVRASTFGGAEVEVSPAFLVSLLLAMGNPIDPSVLSALK